MPVNGRACWDINAAERRMHPLALRRKNDVFAGTAADNRRAEIIYAAWKARPVIA